MKLVTKPMNEAHDVEVNERSECKPNRAQPSRHEGKLTVWRTEGPLDDLAFEIAAELTANGERLVVVDAAGCFDPSRVSRAASTVARNLHVVRAAHSSDLQTTLGPALQTAQQKT